MNIPILNPSFGTLSEGAARWMVRTHEGVTMVPTVDGAVLHLAISSAHGANWHGELCYAPFPVAAGSTLTVSFAARAAQPFTFSVWLGQSQPPYESLVAPGNHFGEQTMTAGWQTYTHRWQPLASEEAARLNFVLGQIDNHVELRDVALVVAA